MEGTARAGPVATPPGRSDDAFETVAVDQSSKDAEVTITIPGRGEVELETTAVDQSTKNPEVAVTVPGGQPPSSISLSAIETPRGYDYGTATYPGAPVPTVTDQPELIDPLRNPHAGSTLTEVTAHTKPTDYPSPLGPIVAPFGPPYVTTATGESVPTTTDGPVQLPDGFLGPQVPPTQADTKTKGADNSPSLPFAQIGPQLMPTDVSVVQASQGTEVPFPGPDGLDGLLVVPSKEDDKSRRQVIDDARGVIPTPTGVHKESPDS